VVADRGYKAILDGAALRKEDGLLSQDSRGPTLEGRVTVPVGSSWFLLENQTNHAVEMRLECSAAE
jgi:hypothetical protein